MRGVYCCVPGAGGLKYAGASGSNPGKVAGAAERPCGVRGVYSGAKDARGAGVPESGLSLEDELEVAPIDADAGVGGIPLEDELGVVPIDADAGVGGIPLEEAGVANPERDEEDDDDDADGNNGGGAAPIAGAEGAIGGAGGGAGGGFKSSLWSLITFP